MKEASYYNKRTDGSVQCVLCPRKCIIQQDKAGFCRVRKNINGSLYSVVYEAVSGVQIDPMEKKPLFHFLPGSRIFSIGTIGCNLRCKFCQNYHISQTGNADYLEKLPVKRAVELCLESGCKSIAYTYNEPTVFFEYALDTAKLARKKGLKNVIVSNGFICPEPLSELIPYIDAANIDLKAFTNKFYGSISAAWMEPILETLKTLHKKGVWLEITNLIIPTLNDNKAEIKQMCTWIKENLGDEVPLHFSAYDPKYQLTNLPSTSTAFLLEARAIAKEIGIKYVYLGNVYTKDGENTTCTKCGKLLIERINLEVIQNNLQNGKCKSCKTKLPGVF